MDKIEDGYYWVRSKAKGSGWEPAQILIGVITLCGDEGTWPREALVIGPRIEPPKEG